MNIYRPLNAPLRLLVAASLVLPALALSTPASPALACTGDGPKPPAERFAPGAPSDRAGIGKDSIVVLGSVVDETAIPPSESTFRTVFKSRVQVVVPLYGAMNSTISVGPTGYSGADCTGGARLFPGEKLLLVLGSSLNRNFLINGPQRNLGQQGEWQTGVFGAPILFDGDSAYYLSTGRSPQQDGDDYRFYVGKSEDVLRTVLTYFNPTPAEQEAAYQFILGKSAPRIIPQGAQRIMPPAAGDGGLVASR